MRIKKRCCALLFALMMTILYANAATLCVGAENNELEISAPSYYKVVNEAETPIKRPEAGMIQTKVSATNHKSSSPARATLIVAVYDDIAKTLKSLDTDTQEIAPNGSVVLSAQTLLPTLDGYTYKYFVWDDFATMSPLQTAPESPMALSAATTVHTAMLSWEAADERAATYNIYRNDSKIATTQNLHYIDYNLDFDTDYVYAVTACTAAGLESAKTELTLQTDASLYSDLLNTNNGITYTKIDDATKDAYGETKELNGTVYRRHGYFYRNGTQKTSGGAWFKMDSNYYTQKATTVYALELTYYIESPTNTAHNIKVQYGAKPGVTQVISIGAADLNCWKTSYLTLPGFDGQNFYGDARGTFRIYLDDGAFTEGDGMYIKNVALMPDAEYTVPNNTNRYQDVSLSMANGNVRGNGIVLAAPGIAKYCTPKQDSWTVESTMGNESCRATQFITSDTPSGKQRSFYFRVSDDYMYGPKQNNAVIRFDYFDNGTDYIYLKYNSSDSALGWHWTSSPVVTARGYKQVLIKRTDTNTWKTATIQIADACFINAMGRLEYKDDLYPSNFRAVSNTETVSNTDADFFITSGDQKDRELYLKSVSVSMSTAKSARAQSALYIIGDSTATVWGSDVAPKTGWGMEFSKYVKDDIQYVNAAKSGYSTKTFLSLTNEFAAAVSNMQKNDYVLIQLGHNDAASSNPNRRTYADDTQAGTDNNYRYNLKTMVYKIREKGAIPVFLTSIRICQFTDGKIADDVVDPYRTAMKELGAELNVPVIDIGSAHRAYLDSIGETNAKAEYLVPGITKDYTSNVKDTVHLSKPGAETIAKMVAEEIVNSHEIRLLKSHIEIPNN